LSGLHPVFFAFIDKGDRLIANESAVFFGFNDLPSRPLGLSFKMTSGMRR
jgi:hypothetical protein